MKRVLLAVTILSMALTPLGVSGQGKKQRDNVVAEMMQKKLKSAQLVLEGVAIADHKKITQGAEDLIQLAKTTTWQLVRSPRYEMHSNDFIRAAENLVQKARDKNVDGAALAYVEMTLTCVRCHQYVRDLRDVRSQNADAQ
jgi:cytochrome c556